MLLLEVSWLSLSQIMNDTVLCCSCFCNSVIVGVNPLTIIFRIISPVMTIFLCRLQLKAGFSRWLELKKANNVATVTSGEFASLSEFVCGLTAPQIMQLPVEAFK